MIELTSALTLVGVALVLGLVAGVIVGWVIHRQPVTRQPVVEPGLEEVIRVWRETRSGMLKVEMDGYRLQSAAEMSAPQRTRLRQAVTALRQWLGEIGRDQPVTGALHPVTPRPPTARPANPAPPVAGGNATPLTEFQSNKINRNPVDIFARALQPAPKAPEEAPGMIAQIDAILQTRLERNPMAGRAIRLTEGVDRSLVVWVGLDSYPGIDAVPDPEIRKLIKECVAEWERTN
jgi:hypothetical protein